MVFLGGCVWCLFDKLFCLKTVNRWIAWIREVKDLRILESERGARDVPHHTKRRKTPEDELHLCAFERS